MDKLFVNGKIETLDQSMTSYQSVGVTGEHIAVLGDEIDLRKLCGVRTEIIDLKGGVLFPGFIDSHTHLMIFAYLLNAIDLAPPRIKNIDDIIRAVRTSVGEHQHGEWITGSRFVEYSLAENRYPNRYDLDEVSPDNPVILYHTSFHACVLNSRALKEMDLDRNSKTPVGGIIEKDSATGELTGVLHDSAMFRVFDHLFVRDLKAMTKDARIKMCSNAMGKFAEAGIVAVSDALVIPESFSIYQDTLDAGKASVRVYAMPELTVSDALINTGIKTGFGNDMLKIGSIKIFEDGGMSNRMAAVGTPYQCEPYGKGLKVISREDLIVAAKRIHTRGFQIAVHCQGDAGLADTLDAFEAVLGPQSTNPLRHRIEHAGCLFPDLLIRAANMNICVSSQPVFFSFLGEGFLNAFGNETADLLYPFKSILKAGIRLGGSSDCPVSLHDPLLGLAGAVMRQTETGHIIGPHERLTMDEALQMFTTGSAWLSFEENITGTIEVGKRADFTILSSNPRDIPVEDVLNLTVKMTVLGGELTYCEE
jgi:predicted amidohydrolase YtcJ